MTLYPELILLEAVPFMVPPAVAGQVLTSDPPDGELARRVRLPFPAVLVFFDQIALTELDDTSLESIVVVDVDTQTRSPVLTDGIGLVARMANTRSASLSPWITAPTPPAATMSSSASPARAWTR
jgi:hypothetical protein